MSTSLRRCAALLTEQGYASSRRGSGTVTDLPDAASRDGRGALMPRVEGGDTGVVEHAAHGDEAVDLPVEAHVHG